MSEQTQQDAVGMVDTWAKFIKSDLPAEIERLRKKPMGVEQLQVEMHSTVLHALVQIGDWVVRMRDDVYSRLADVEVDIEGLDDRVQSVEPEAEDTQLLPEDAQAIGKLSTAAKILAEESLKLTTDPTGVAKLQEIISIADYCATLVSEKTIEVEPEDDEDAEPGDGDGVTVDGVAEVG